MRILAIGDAALMDGFALLGMETHSDLDEEQLESLLLQIVSGRERTLIYLQQDIALWNCPTLQQIRKSGGEILISELPLLNQPQQRHASIDALVTRTLGASALEGTHE